MMANILEIWGHLRYSSKFIIISGLQDLIKRLDTHVHFLKIILSLIGDSCKFVIFEEQNLE